MFFNALFCLDCIMQMGAGIPRSDMLGFVGGGLMDMVNGRCGYTNLPGNDAQYQRDIYLGQIHKGYNVPSVTP